MRVLRVESAVICVHVEMARNDTYDIYDFTDYRRWGADSWEVLMGESWEPLYACEKMEAAYQHYLKEGGA